jgi:S-adenosylmethionine uptake transporter
LATRHGRAHLIRGVVGVVAMMMLFHSITLLPLATAMTLNYTSPLFLALMLMFWSREPVRPSLVLALLLGFGGVVLVLQPTLAEDQWLGALIGLGSGIGAGAAFFNLRRLGQLGEPEWRTVFYFLLISSIVGLLWVLLTGHWHPLDGEGALILLGVGIFGGAGQVCVTAAYKHGRTLMTANLAYSAVVFSSLFGFLFWEEILPVVSWLGIALVIASGVVATLLSRGRPLERG